MKRFRWIIILGAVLIGISISVYFLHFALFHDAHHIWIYLVGDVAFVPLEVFLVGLVIDSFISRREKQEILSKMNMVIGTFFSEIGFELIGRFGDFSSDEQKMALELSFQKEWTVTDFKNASQKVVGKNYGISFSIEHFQSVKEFLNGRRDFLLDLLSNPNLLDHDEFTDLLWAVFHLMEEFNLRGDLSSLGEKDRAHLCGDLNRIYMNLFKNWISYLIHLKKHYPYMFDYAIRANPLQKH